MEDPLLYGPPNAYLWGSGPSRFPSPESTHMLCEFDKTKIQRNLQKHCMTGNFQVAANSSSHEVRLQ